MNIEPLLVSVPDVLSLLCIGRTTFYQMIATGQFGPEPLRVFGKKKLYKFSDVQSWVEQNCPNSEKVLKLREAK